MSDPVAEYMSLWEKFRSFGLEERVLTMSLGDDVPDSLREVAQIRCAMNTLLHGMSRMEINQIAAHILEAHNVSS
jgi:ribosomal protein L6P/L9E